MALATQCPHCQTTFRVAHDQLKLRAGLVRCGACKQIFNGIEHLLRPGENETSLPPTTSTGLPAEIRTARTDSHVDSSQPSSEQEAARSRSSTGHFTNPDDLYPAFDLIDPMRIEPSLAPTKQNPADPLPRMTLMRFGNDEIRSEIGAQADPAQGDYRPKSLHAGTGSSSLLLAPSQSPDELDQAIEYLQRRPWRGAKKSLSREDVEGTPRADPEMEEPGFVARSRRNRPDRGIQAWLGMSTALLLVVALGQSAYAFRDQIAARLPATKPWLSEACTLIGCQIELPAQVDAVSIESNELSTINQTRNTFALNLLLRNRSNIPQRWPNIELTLLDASERPVARRIFTEREYLPGPPNTADGFGPKSEQAAKLAFELQQQKAANYRVYLFYP